MAATAATVVVEQNPLDFRMRIHWLLRAGTLPVRTLRETRLVLGALGDRLRGRPIAGRFRTVRVVLPADPAESATKRALMIAGESFAPNTYVLGIDEESGSMLVHELVDQGKAR